MSRVVLIGAHRRRQGIGPYLARFLADAGAEVVAGLSSRDAADAPALVAAARPDALVIASPSITHDAYLQLGLDEGVHVLCEKPLCWGGPDPAARAAGYVDAFLDRQLHLVVNAQWPFTLDAYRTLFPQAPVSPPRRLAVRLSPGTRGADMIPDAVPHVLSLLFAVLPDPDATVERVRMRGAVSDSSHLEISFDYVAAGHTVDVAVDLRQGGAQPREAGYGFDGHYARRVVEMDGYRLHLEGAGRRVPLPDPTPALVQSFLARISSGRSPAPDPNAGLGMALLETLHAAYAR